MHFRVKKCIKYYDGYFSMRSNFMIDLLFKKSDAFECTYFVLAI